MSEVTVMMLGERATLHRNKHRDKLAMHPFDAGIDLYPNVPKYNPTSMKYDGHNGPMTVHVPTGVSMLVPRGSVGLIRPRSSSLKKLGGHSVVPGTIDADYTGEIFVSVTIPSWSAFCTLVTDLVMYTAGEVAIAQMLVVPCQHVFSLVVEEFPDGLTRKGNGYGSTDRRKEVEPA